MIEKLMTQKNSGSSWFRQRCLYFCNGAPLLSVNLQSISI